MGLQLRQLGLKKQKNVIADSKCASGGSYLAKVCTVAVVSFVILMSLAFHLTFTASV